MKVLPYTSGGWLLMCCSVYALVGLCNVFVYHFTEIEYIEAAWIIIMSLPLWIKMKWLVNIDTMWERIKNDRANLL